VCLALELETFVLVGKPNPGSSVSGVSKLGWNAGDDNLCCFSEVVGNVIANNLPPTLGNVLVALQDLGSHGVSHTADLGRAGNFFEEAID